MRVLKNIESQFKDTLGDAITVNFEEYVYVDEYAQVAEHLNEYIQWRSQLKSLGCAKPTTPPFSSSKNLK